MIPLGRKVLAVGAPAVRPAVDIVLEALAVLFETKGLAALAAPLVDPLRWGMLLRMLLQMWMRMRRHILGGRHRRRRRRMVGSSKVVLRVMVVLRLVGRGRILLLLLVLLWFVYAHRHGRRPGHKALLLAAVGIVVRRIVGCGGGTISVGSRSSNHGGGGCFTTRHGHGRIRHGRIRRCCCCFELVLKGAGVPLQDGPAGGLNIGNVVFARSVIARGALALGAAGRRQGKALAVELEALAFFAGARGRRGRRTAQERLRLLGH